MNIQSIHFWGDSIFKGIVFDEIRGRYVILKKNAARRLGEALGLSIVNNSLMGRTAPEGLEALKETAESLDNTLVVLEYGGNDCDFDWAQVAQEPDREHFPKTTIKKFSESLKLSAELVRLRGGLPVFCSLPPLDAARYFEWISRGLSQEAILVYIGEVQSIFRWQESYSAMVVDIAKEIGCACLPLRDAFVTYTGSESLMCLDGIHPNEKGHAVMAHEALKALLTLDAGLQPNPAAFG